jgi:hypothetical protein
MSELTEADKAYEERNRLVALLARLYPSGLRHTAIEGWDPEWNGCVFIDTPVGQMSWHYHDREAHLFDGLPPYVKPWDGHTTEQKHERLAKLMAIVPRSGIFIGGGNCAPCGHATYHVHWFARPPTEQPCHQCGQTVQILGWIAEKPEEPS